MSGAPGVNSQCLSIADVSKVRNELEAINDFATSTTTLDTKAKNTTKTPLQVLLSRLVVRVTLKTRVGDPADIRTLLEVLRQSQSVLGMSLSSQAESFNAQKQLLGSERVQG